MSEADETLLRQIKDLADRVNQAETEVEALQAAWHQRGIDYATQTMEVAVRHMALRHAERGNWPDARQALTFARDCARAVRRRGRDGRSLSTPEAEGRALATYRWGPLQGG